MMNRHIFYGSVASLGLFAAYLTVLTALESFGHALQQFAELWYLMIPLVAGFGVQIGLYSFIRHGLKHAPSGSTKGSVAASGGVSTGSMVLCCLHHVTDVLPLIGLTAAALFLSQYQVFFLVMGILSNMVGIIMMFSIMQRSNLHPDMGFFSGIFRYNMLRTRNMAIFSSGIILAGLFAFSAFSVPAETLSGNVIGEQPGTDLPKLTNSEGGVSVDVTPLEFRFGKEVLFEIGLNTHQGSLDFDVAEIAVLRDGDGNVYSPLGWEGSPPGGHHRNGKLTFPPIGESGRMELVLSNIYGVPERVFTWELGG